MAYFCTLVISRFQSRFYYLGVHDSSYSKRLTLKAVTTVFVKNVKLTFILKQTLVFIKINTKKYKNKNQVKRKNQ